MLGKTLRASRYLRRWNGDLAHSILHELPYLDFEETLDWYTAVAPHLDRDSGALLTANDRFYLLTTVMRRKDALHPWLFERCREVEMNPDGHLDLWAREHYKSTIITFAGIIQEIVCNPEITIGLFSHTRSAAGKFLEQIMSELEHNEDLKELFPDVLHENPRRDAMRWSLTEGIVVKRASNPKEGTLEAHGLVQGQPTGRHFALMVYDDIIDEKHVSNAEMVRKSTRAFEMSDNLGAGDNARKQLVGTRYSFNDTYGVLISNKVVTPRIYPATEDGKLDGAPVFISQQRWDEKKNIQRSTVAAQMLQNPLAGQENTFYVEWFTPYEVRPRTINVYIMADPSKGGSATSDRTAIAVVGVDTAGNKYLLDGYRHRMTLSQRWVALRDLYRRWTRQPGVAFVKVGYERYGQQTDQEYFEERMQIEGQSSNFPITELNWVKEGKQSKKDRVERLEPDFRNGRFHIPALVHEVGKGKCLWSINKETQNVALTPLQALTRKMQMAMNEGESSRIASPLLRRDEDGNLYDVTRALMEEMTFFPFAPKDDLVDAVSRIYDMEPLPPTLFIVAPAEDDMPEEVPFDA